MNGAANVRREAVFGDDASETAALRTVVLASADAGLRQRLRASLTGLRWQVREASGGAEAMAQLEDSRSEALLVDSWLPDLEVGEFATVIRMLYPSMELLRVDGGVDGGARSPRRNELLHALREAQNGPLTDTAAWAVAPESVPAVEDVSRAGLRVPELVSSVARKTADQGESRNREEEEARLDSARQALSVLMGKSEPTRTALPKEHMLPEMVGASAPMRELTRLIRLVAPRSATVLIEGETGTGKEVVAKALHRLSARAGKPFAVLNCAAIPEALLEAELFGHTRGAFTGAVQSRTGRIEAAHGGTLFLDEIGEMPMALQAKMLRFLECGELQRVGDNETMRVDVRVIAATHQPLEKLATSAGAERTFRLDLHYWLRIWLERGAFGGAGRLPAASEDVMDHVFTVRSLKA
jgi:DNA-binding NtrC family response regulator